MKSPYESYKAGEQLSRMRELKSYGYRQLYLPLDYNMVRENRIIQIEAVTIQGRMEKVGPQQEASCRATPHFSRTSVEIK